MSLYKKIASNFPAELNSKVASSFTTLYKNSDVRKTHLFAGRYENIYLNEQHIPQLKVLINEALSLAEKILGQQHLRAGYWFNYMPPNATTTLHSHDDDDELLSCVYYVEVPENSGNLIIYDEQKKIEIESKTGDFIFFKPNVRHEVSRNNSTEHRLSIGINFGQPKA